MGLPRIQDYVPPGCPAARPAVPDPSALLTYGQVAAALGVHRDTVKRYVRRGQLAVVRMGRARRVDPADMRAFMREHRQAPAAVAAPESLPVLWEVGRGRPNPRAKGGAA